MSSAGLTYVRGGAGKAAAGKAAQAQAAKARRQKLILAGGAVLFVLLLVVQVPRVLNATSSAEPAVAPPPVAVPAPAPVQAAPAPGPSADMKAQIERIQTAYLPKDPFAARAGSAPPERVGVRPAPAGARDPFVARVGSVSQQTVAVIGGAGVRDPFSPREAAPAEPPAVAPAPAAEPIQVTTQRLRGYTIIILSSAVRNGRPAAVQAAAAARARGVPDVAVLRSSDYSTLRPGYFAVYSRVFETRAEAERSVGHVRSLGYPTAYVRPLGR